VGIEDGRGVQKGGLTPSKGVGDWTTGLVGDSFVGDSGGGSVGDSRLRRSACFWIRWHCGQVEEPGQVVAPQSEFLGLGTGFPFGGEFGTELFFAGRPDLHGISSEGDEFVTQVGADLAKGADIAAALGDELVPAFSE